MLNNRKYIGIILRLSKYRLSLIVTFSALTGYFLTGNSNPVTSLLLSFGVFFLSSGSSALNQVEERKYDALMNRTKNRPLPSGEITPLSAFIISLLLILSGSLFLGYLGAVPLTLGIANVILYNFIYTPLKRLSSAAILPGALVGAVCPLIGSTTGGLPLFDPAVLFISIFVFLWQVPHFWLLLVSYSRDYKRAGFAGIYDFMNLSMIKILVFAWGVISSGFLFSFPLFGLKISHTMAPFLALVNLLFIIAFYKLIFTEKSERSLQKAFILVNSFAVLIFLVFIFGRV